MTDVVAIGSRRELMVDDFLIRELTGGQARPGPDSRGGRTRLCRAGGTACGGGHRLHTPIPHEVALITDRPWEGNKSHNVTVLRDADLYSLPFID